MYAIILLFYSIIDKYCRSYIFIFYEPFRLNDWVNSKRKLRKTKVGSVVGGTAVAPKKTIWRKEQLSVSVKVLLSLIKPFENNTFINIL